MIHSARYMYKCPVHEEFDVPLPFGSEVPQWSLCPHMDEHDHEQCREAPCKHECLRSSERVHTPPSSVAVKDGTGARKGG